MQLGAPKSLSLSHTHTQIHRHTHTDMMGHSGLREPDTGWTEQIFPLVKSLSETPHQSIPRGC